MADDERLPIEEIYASQYAQREADAYHRITQPIMLEQRVTPEGVPVAVDLTPEGLQRSADAAAGMPTARTRAFQAIDEVKKEPTLRGAVNGVLSTLSGGVLTLDAIDEHLQAEALGKPSPLAAKLKSAEVLKLIDPAGNAMQAVARETLKREGMPQELIDRVAPTVGMLAVGSMPPATGVSW